MDEQILAIYYNIINSQHHFQFTLYTNNDNIYHCVYKGNDWFMINEDSNHQNLSLYPKISYEFLENISPLRLVERFEATNDYADGETIVRIVRPDTKYTVYIRE